MFHINHLEISKKLYQLEERRNKSTSDEEEEGKVISKIFYCISFMFYFLGWTKCETNVKEIVTKIWKIWCDERERRPRAGIIPIYYGPSGSIEVSSFFENYFAVLISICRFF
jgi:hypothetical protein